eukprot:3077104-Pleurochrysis_carterae.AAC.1
MTKAQQAHTEPAKSTAGRYEPLEGIGDALERKDPIGYRRGFGGDQTIFCLLISRYMSLYVAFLTPRCRG